MFHSHPNCFCKDSSGGGHERRQAHESAVADSTPERCDAASSADTACRLNNLA